MQFLPGWLMPPEGLQRRVQVRECPASPPEVVVEHQQQAPLTLVELRRARRRGRGQELAVYAHPLWVVDVQHPPQGAQQIALLVRRAGGRNVPTGFPPQS